MKRIIVSSWDDGWADAELIDFLNMENIKTTFCLVGKNLKNFKNQKLYKNKNFEIVNHTMNHLELTKCNDHKLRSEVLDCQKLLEDTFGRKIYGFCYPNGLYNEYVEKTIFELGFVYARTIGGKSQINRSNYKIGVDSCIDKCNKNFWEHYKKSQNVFNFYGHASPAMSDLNQVKIYLKDMKNNGDKFITIIDYIKKILN